ncbi:uncharacterized protein LOC127524644 isoform X8 [Ctenopharyngodon idella]|uniref:uncharacterized protein LOC127524644 isoform X8 n=1 Tax=Ctenopharyngodon idella TaxID=7959 RepID=UPI00222E7956|nr:uncharacterized protein LOC127524644 isoform X8 [Ctenopharyngodon idella]
MKFTLFTATLLVWMCVGESGDRYPLCCLKVTNTRIPVENIVNYEIQEPTGICAIRAVRFHTRKGLNICSDPDDSWAKRAMESVDRRMTGQDRPPTCCLKVTNTRIPAENIVSYDIQESTGVCAPRAVRFHTRKNKIICSDPDSEWAKKAMKIVDGRTTAKPSIKPKCFTSTTNMIPTTTTTPETPRPKTETSETTTRDHPDCCLTVTNTRTPAEDIVDYHIQDSSLCPIRAVRFRTIKNKVICSDPEGSWAKSAIKEVNGRRTMTEEPSEELTANLITTTTAIQRNGTEGKRTGTNTQTTWTRYGHPESCCSTTISTTIPVNPPVAFRPLLTRKRSHSKKMLHKYQSNNRNTKY